MSRLAAQALCANFLAILPAGLAQAAETFPVRPVRIVVPTGAGGVTDVVADSR
jgi:tripartite-type tricarboxylate transporter receptor subunit TctC